MNPASEAHIATLSNLVRRNNVTTTDERILQLVATRPMTVTEAAESLKLSRVFVNRRMNYLADCGELKVLKPVRVGNYRPPRRFALNAEGQAA
jgi:predicted ArsR family transcriptional regulator